MWLETNVRICCVAATRWFCVSDPEAGWSRYITLDYLYLPKNGLLVKDSCSVEAEITIHGVANVV